MITPGQGVLYGVPKLAFSWFSLFFVSHMFIRWERESPLRTSSSVLDTQTSRPKISDLTLNDTDG